MPNAASTYDPNGTLRTVTDAPDYSLVNLGRDLVNDRREDYEERRKNRGTERPISATGGGGTGRREPPSPSMPMMPLPPGASSLGPGYRVPYLDPYRPFTNQTPTNVVMGGVTPSPGLVQNVMDPGWEQFLAMTEHRRRTAGRPGAGAGSTAPGTISMPSANGGLA